jgi:hypothetical protein
MKTGERVYFLSAILGTFVVKSTREMPEGISSRIKYSANQVSGLDSRLRGNDRKNLFHKHSLIVFSKTLLCSVGNLSAFTRLAGEFHFFWVKAICFDKFFAIMTEKNDGSSIRIERYLLFPISRDIYEVTFDTIESSIFTFWIWDWGLNWFRHRGNCREERVFDELKVIDNKKIKLL